MDNKHQTIFSPTDCISEELMLSYIDDKLLPEQKHEVEKHLADCELCSDALEGLMLMESTENTRKVLTDLRNQSFANNSPAKKNAKIVWFNNRFKVAAAASILLLVGLTLVFNYWSNRKTINNNDQLFSQQFEPYQKKTENQKDSSVEASNAVSGSTIKDVKTVEVAENSFKSINDKYLDDISQNKNGEQDQSNKMSAADNQQLVTKNTVSEISLGNTKTENLSEKSPILVKTDEENTKDNSITDRAANQNGSGVSNATGSTSTMYVSGKKESSVHSWPGTSTKKSVQKIEKGKNKQAKLNSTPAKAESEVISQADMSKSQPTASAGLNKFEQARLTNAMDKYDNKDYKSALKLFDELLATDPDNYDALFFAGVSSLCENNPDKAITYLKKVTAIYNGKYFEDSKWYLALAYIKKDMKEAAINLLKEVITMKGNYKLKAEETLNSLK